MKKTGGVSPLFSLCFHDVSNQAIRRNPCLSPANHRVVYDIDRCKLVDMMEHVETRRESATNETLRVKICRQAAEALTLQYEEDHASMH